MECRHKIVSKCHESYKTAFTPQQEEKCTDRFEKHCKITFNKKTVQHVTKVCYKPMENVCDGSGVEKCQNVTESSCSTKYIRSEHLKENISATKYVKLYLFDFEQGSTTYSMVVFVVVAAGSRWHCAGEAAWWRRLPRSAATRSWRPRSRFPRRAATSSHGGSAASWPSCCLNWPRTPSARTFRNSFVR